MENSRFEFRAYCPRTKQLGKVVFMNYMTKTCGFYGMTTHSGRKIFERSFKDVIFMQYTGLLDKNGVEIYEGDIVKFIPSGEYGKVTTFGKSQNLGIEWENSKTTFFTPMFYLGCESELEIIGNIYEHSYLLDNN